MNLKELCQFLVIAKKQTYAAGDKAKKTLEKDKSTTITFEQGDWKYHDNYFGGKQKTLVKTSPYLMKQLFCEMKKLKTEYQQQFPLLSEFDVTVEQTHHGPYLEKPALFIEIGSTEKEWVRKDLGILAANAIKEIVEKAPKAKFENYAGFGGIHYCPSFNKIQIENEKAAIGHIVPKYAEDAITEDIVKQALEKSFAKKAIIDWKGIKSVAREKVVAALENLGIEYFKTGNFEKINK